MTTYFWVVLGVCIVVVLHPYITYPISLALFRAIRRHPLVPTGSPPESYAVACCVHNEEAVIEKKLQNMFDVQSKLGNCSVLFYSDGSTDNTNEHLNAAGDRIYLISARDRSGKSVGMTKLVSASSAEIIVFTDANVIIDPDTISNIGRYFMDPTVGCVAGHLRYINSDESTTACTGSVYWQVEEFLKQLESDTGSAVGADGSLFAIRRSLFVPPPAYIIDDFHTSMSIYCSKYRVVRAPDVLAYERAASSSKDEFRRKVRIACRAFNCHRLLWPSIRSLPADRVYKYLSHKLLRWILFYFIALGALSASVLVTLYFGLAGLIALASLLGLGSIAACTSYVRPLNVLWEAFLSICATGLGVYHSLCGKTFQTWEFAKSTRLRHQRS